MSALVMAYCGNLAYPQHGNAAWKNHPQCATAAYSLNEKAMPDHRKGYTLLMSSETIPQTRGWFDGPCQLAGLVAKISYTKVKQNLTEG
mmetsp:Transcript_79621/g.140541  ORF Transcript_79621/g.140541 Transcript_79621/m.140541 type:complete len:89 (-) Transcript_79621:1174-1440(-)